MFFSQFLNVAQRLNPFFTETTTSTKKARNFDTTEDCPANGNVIPAAVSTSLAGNAKNIRRIAFVAGFRVFHVIII
jgi:hypothetical protein